jgi:hypothetical protein
LIFHHLKLALEILRKLLIHVGSLLLLVSLLLHVSLLLLNVSLLLMLVHGLLLQLLKLRLMIDHLLLYVVLNVPLGDVRVINTLQAVFLGLPLFRGLVLPEVHFSAHHVLGLGHALTRATVVVVLLVSVAILVVAVVFL